ncbi:MAG: thiamine phosphate synthase [Pirellulales bacterium]|nr:thiamine phosphate synthase [Pirellulales bacterium]
MTAECVESQLRALYGLPAVVISDECLDPPESEDDEPESCNDAPVPPLPPDSLPLPNDAPPPEAAGLPDRIGVLRALDAAANRGREGLRVVEDYVRFVLDDRNLTEQLKCFRHILTAALEPIPLEHRMAARETLADVGTDITTPSEQTRDAPEAVVAAGFARLQESLRSLEEFGKLLDQDIAAAFEQLRYEAYTLQRAVELTRISHGRLATAWLYVLLDGQASIEDFDLLARDLVLAGVHVLQLRDKKLGDGELLERASLLRELTAGSETLFIMNDRPDLALLAKADGVHVGQDDLPVKAVRSIVGPEMLIGVSTHSIEQARAAVLDGANYLGVGPVFPSKTKEFADFPGLDLVRAVSAEIRLPAFALGGIDQQNLPEVLEAGLNRVAVGAAVTASDNPATAVVELLKVLQ